MSNGRICCTIRKTARDVQLLAAKRRKAAGLRPRGDRDHRPGRPGPVAQTFFMDEEIAETYLIDSIITLVDAKHAAQQLNDRQEARRQWASLTRSSSPRPTWCRRRETDALIHRLKHMNPRAPGSRRCISARCPSPRCAGPARLQPERQARHRPRLPEGRGRPHGHDHDHGQDHHGHDHEHGEHCSHPCTSTCTRPPPFITMTTT